MLDFMEKDGGKSKIEDYLPFQLVDCHLKMDGRIMFVGYKSVIRRVV
jgi:hypothetical protein